MRGTPRGRPEGSPIASRMQSRAGLWEHRRAVHVRAQPRQTITALAAHTLASRLVIYGSGALSAILIARALGPDGRGLYYLPVAMGSIAASIAGTRTEQAQFRLWGKEPAERFASSAVILAAGLGLAALGLTWLVYGVGRGGAFAQLSPGELALVVTLLPLWVHTILIRSLLTMGGDLRRTNV